MTGEQVIEKAAPGNFFLQKTLDFGLDPATPVSQPYATLVGFAGVIRQVVVNLD